jgi:hypothetical protein
MSMSTQYFIGFWLQLPFFLYTVWKVGNVVERKSYEITKRWVERHWS